MRWVALSAVVAALVSISSFGFATVVQVLPGLFDPDGTGIVTAHWITRQGLADDVGKANHALFLQKDGPTSVNASAFAVIGGVEGLTLTELGFDYRNDGHCGAAITLGRDLVWRSSRASPSSSMRDLDLRCSTISISTVHGSANLRSVRLR